MRTVRNEAGLTVPASYVVTNLAQTLRGFNVIGSYIPARGYEKLETRIGRKGRRASEENMVDFLGKQPTQSSPVYLPLSHFLAASISVKHFTRRPAFRAVVS